MAIQVNGTTVIDNSRNLTNVGGLKTVNGTSLVGSGNISAGGQTTVITENGSTSSNSATLNFTFGDYRENIIVISGLRNTSSTANNILYGRMLNASGGAMTGDHIFGQVRVHNAGVQSEYWTGNWYFFGGSGLARSTQSGCQIIVRAFNAFDTGKLTHVEISASNHSAFDSDSRGELITFHVSDGANSPMKNAGIQFYITSNQIQSGVKFTKYGVV